jgi:hypothetical protein
MTPECRRQITELLHGARATTRRAATRSSPMPAGDPTLRGEVEAMLAGLDHAGRFETTR